MSIKRSRIRTIQTLLAGSVIANDVSFVSILDELDEVLRSRRVLRRKRKQLLQILHSSRAVDTSLKVFVGHHAGAQQELALGTYLTRLATGVGTLQKLPTNSAKRYKRNIVKPRNYYMHSAGAFPANEQEILIFLSEMHACVVEIIAL